MLNVTRYAVKPALKRRKREIWKNLSNLFHLRTVPLKYDTFRAYHSAIGLRSVPFKYSSFGAHHLMKSTWVRMRNYF